jgi:hypothetical protein
MTITTKPMLDQLLDLVRMLSPADRAELVALIVRELAGAPPEQPPRMTPAEARATLIDISAAIGALPQPRLTIGEQLEADRRGRDQALIGHAPDEAVDADS